ncbi:FeoA family protein [Paenibacillus sp. J31TS4]|uniref:FeoA family protein n=1 Tax=Paenibacillus sp. J31TS4 TaxID=2807195 RepID=UPI001BCE95A4|nr:FeoA family protein [Paenibacillus sp. J31TS4]
MNVDKGGTVRVADLSGVHAQARRRLTDLGIMESAIVSLKKLLPFGGPVLVETNGQWVALRRKEAASILVDSL